MSTNKDILKSATGAVCNFLNVDESLFFCSFREPRIIEARRYVCYLAIDAGVSATHVSKYLGYREARTSQQYHASIAKHIYNYQNSQCTRDIEKLTALMS